MRANPGKSDNRQIASSHSSDSNILPTLSITFCILSSNRTPWVKNTLLSIQNHCKVSHSVKILSQGQPDIELLQFLDNLGDDTELVVTPFNIGCGAGRRLLSQSVTSPLTMMIDDDTYLTEGAIDRALKAFEQDHTIGAVSMPIYDPQGRIIHLGGSNLIIRNGVLIQQEPELDFQAELVEVNHIGSGAMLYRTDMRESFSWEDKLQTGFEDLDKSLQILRDGRWKQALVPKGRIIHDRSWLVHLSKYEKTRLNGLTLRSQYRLFCKKWGIRLDLVSHLLYELVFPTLTLLRCSWSISLISKFVEMRRARKLRRYYLSSRRKGTLDSSKHRDHFQRYYAKSPSPHDSIRPVSQFRL